MAHVSAVDRPRAKDFDRLVKSFFTHTGPHDSSQAVAEDDTDIPSRSPSRMGFRETQPLKPRPKIKRVPVPDIEEEPAHEADEDEDDGDPTDSSDEWSAESDTGDANIVFYTPSSSFPSRPASPVPSYSPISETPLILAPPPRPTIPHHGLSRSALQHQKWMWNARYDEWMQWQMEVEQAEAEASVYGGIADVPPPASPPPARRTLTPEPELKASINIFPRTGDLASLHDPQAAKLDRTFCNYPLCTIQKVLFLFNMDKQQTCASSAGSSTSADESELGSGEDSASGPSRGGSPVSERSVSKAQTNDWDTRWQVLTELVKLPNAGSPTVKTSIGLPVVARSLEDVTEEAPTAHPLSHFFFAEASEDEPNSDEEDYGEVLAQPQFARGVEVAREFLENEMCRVDCRSGARTLRF